MISNPVRKHNRTRSHSLKAVSSLIHFVVSGKQDGDVHLPAGDMVATMLELYHGSAIEASPPIVSVGHCQNTMKCVIHRTINTRVCKGVACQMCLLVAFWASAVLILNGKWRNELGACWLSAV